MLLTAARLDFGHVSRGRTSCVETTCASQDTAFVWPCTGAVESLRKRKKLIVVSRTAGPGAGVGREGPGTSTVGHVQTPQVAASSVATTAAATACDPVRRRRSAPLVASNSVYLSSSRTSSVSTRMRSLPSASPLLGRVSNCCPSSAVRFRSSATPMSSLTANEQPTRVNNNNNNDPAHRRLSASSVAGRLIPIDHRSTSTRARARSDSAARYRFL